jgi:DMSO reductase family type II enzyme chaperone
MNESDMEREIDRALARCVLYDALALGFRPPGEETLRRLTHPEEVQALAAAATLLDPERRAGLEEAVRRLGGSPCECCQTEGRSDSLADLAARHETLFGHTTRGAVSAYETEYGEDTAFQQPQQLGDVSGFLGAFGLQLAPGEHERVDHVSVECEFMAFLARKQAYALEHGEQEMARTVRRAQRLFLRDHLGRFAPALGRLVAQEPAGGFYAALGDLCRRFIGAECAREEVPAGPEFLALRTPAEDATPMACGTGSHLLQIRGGEGAGGDEPAP